MTLKRLLLVAAPLTAGAADNVFAMTRNTDTAGGTVVHGGTVPESATSQFFADDRDNFLAFVKHNHHKQCTCKTGHVGSSCEAVKDYCTDNTYDGSTGAVDGGNLWKPECKEYQTCDPFVHCHRLENGKLGYKGDSFLHKCPVSSNLPVAVVSAETAKQCGCSGNQDPKENCGACKTDFTNWPFCTAVTTTTDCPTAKSNINEEYYKNMDKSFKTDGKDVTASFENAVLGEEDRAQCGNDLCGTHEKCCAGKTMAHFNSRVRNTNGANWEVEKSHPFCINRAHECCGAKVCPIGGKCLDPLNGICSNDYVVNEDQFGKTPCQKKYDGGRLVTKNNTVLIKGSNTDWAWCHSWETCCDGVCCKNRHQTCTDVEEKYGEKDHISADKYGWDYWTTTASISDHKKNRQARYCSNDMPPTVGFRVIFLPLLLAIGFGAGFVLVAGAGAPAPIKLPGFLILFICFLGAFHYQWRWAVLVALVTILTNVAAGGALGNKPGVTVLFCVLAQLVVFLNYFNGQLMGSLIAAQAPFDNMGKMTGRTLDGMASKCYNEYGWFMRDVSLGYSVEMPSKFHAENLGFLDSAFNVREDRYYGYCNPGWLLTMDFFYNLAFLLQFVQLVFSFKCFFSDPDAGQSTKVSPEEAAPAPPVGAAP